MGLKRKKLNKYKRNKPASYYKQRKLKKEVSGNSFSLSFDNRVTYKTEIIYSEPKKEFIYVNYDILFENNWVTVLRLDNHHLPFHMHVYLDAHTRRAIERNGHVKQKGSINNLRTWAIDYIKKHLEKYRERFIKNSLNVDKNTESQ